MKDAVTRYPSQVRSIGGKVRSVKNLGWLLRNWKSVSHFVLRTHLDGTPLQGVLFIAFLKGQHTSYSCGWAGDTDHVISWLKRPVFYGVKTYVNPPVGVDAASLSALRDNPNESFFVIAK